MVTFRGKLTDTVSYYLNIEDNLGWIQCHYDTPPLYSDENASGGWLTLDLELYNWLIGDLESEKYNDYREVAGLFFGEMNKYNYRGLFDKVIYFEGIPDYENSISMRAVAEEVKRKGYYPKSRDEKFLLILD